MSDLITIADARLHLRGGDELSDGQLEQLLVVAEEAVSDFLNRPLIDADGAWKQASDVPTTVLHAIKLVLTDLYEHRITPLADDIALRRLIGRHQVLSIG